MWPRPMYAKEDDVRGLRRWAEEGYWSRCLDATMRLLFRLPGQRALELARRQVAARLPMFERHAPGVTWPREFIQAVDEAGRQDGRTWPEDDALPGPGASNFSLAVKQLWEAGRIADDHPKCAMLLGKAIANVIMAEIQEGWAARYPEKWKRWGQVVWDENSEEQRELKKEIISGPEARRIGCRAWLELAGVLEKAVARPSGSPEAELLALRQAAEDEDWNDCREATRQLLLRLSARSALELAREQVAARLPVFERHQPGVTWPREFIEAVIEPGRRESLVWSDDYAFDGPGANNFISAVRKLWEAGRMVDGDAERVESLVGAIAGIILAEKVENWGARDLAQWRRWYHEPLETQGEEHKRLREEMSDDPEGRRIVCKAWLALADELEKASSRPGGTAS